MITDPTVAPPPVLYRYYPPDRVNAIEDTVLRFSRPSEFNDTFDSYHRLPTAADQRVKNARVRIRAGLGVVCLAEDAENHLMWVNYAKGHTGFVVGFDSSSEFFSADGRQLRKVLYRRKPPVFREADANGCFYKSPEWSYEREWRCVRTFERDETRLALFDWPMIKVVILGSRIDPWVRARLLQSVTLLSAESGTALPELRRSVATLSTWRFSSAPAAVRMCECCKGEGVVYG